MSAYPYVLITVRSYIASIGSLSHQQVRPDISWETFFRRLHISAFNPEQHVLRVTNNNDSRIAFGRQTIQETTDLLAGFNFTVYVIPIEELEQADVQIFNHSRQPRPAPPQLPLLNAGEQAMDMDFAHRRSEMLLEGAPPAVDDQDANNEPVAEGEPAAIGGVPAGVERAPGVIRGVPLPISMRGLPRARRGVPFRRHAVPASPPPPASPSSSSSSSNAGSVSRAGSSQASGRGGRASSSGSIRSVSTHSGRLSSFPSSSDSESHEDDEPNNDPDPDDEPEPIDVDDNETRKEVFLRLARNVSSEFYDELYREFRTFQLQPESFRWERRSPKMAQFLERVFQLD